MCMFSVGAFRLRWILTSRSTISMKTMFCFAGRLAVCFVPQVAWQFFIHSTCSLLLKLEVTFSLSLLLVKTRRHRTQIYKRFEPVSSFYIYHKLPLRRGLNVRILVKCIFVFAFLILLLLFIPLHQNVVLILLTVCSTQLPDPLPFFVLFYVCFVSLN
jgi:hypothetical protein